jgi:hypothetical protein
MLSLAAAALLFILLFTYRIKLDEKNLEPATSHPAHPQVTPEFRDHRDDDKKNNESHYRECDQPTIHGYASV